MPGTDLSSRSEWHCSQELSGQMGDLSGPSEEELKVHLPHSNIDTRVVRVGELDLDFSPA